MCASGSKRPIGQRSLEGQVAAVDLTRSGWCGEEAGVFEDQIAALSRRGRLVVRSIP